MWKYQPRSGQNPKYPPNLPTKGRQYLLKLLNYIWEGGSFSETWNDAIVVPIAKPGKNPAIQTHIPNKYYMQNDGETHKPSTPLDPQNNVISSCQSGFRQMHMLYNRPTNKYRNQHMRRIHNQSKHRNGCPRPRKKSVWHGMQTTTNLQP